MVIGDGRKYLTALIQIEYDNVAKWAQEQSLAYTTFKSLSLLPEVLELIQGEVRETNKEFAQVETIKKFRLLDKELDHGRRRSHGHAQTPAQGSQQAVRRHYRRNVPQ